MGALMDIPALDFLKFPQPPSLSVYNQWVTRDSLDHIIHVDALVQDILQRMLREHTESWARLPDLGLRQRWEPVVHVSFDIERSQYRVHLEYRRTVVHHEDWCHLVVGCTQEDHCTCDLAWELDQWRHTPPALPPFNFS